MGILLADDSPVMRKILRTALEGMSPEKDGLVEATEGAEAMVVLAQTAGIDLIIADWDLPGLSGPELLEKVRAVKETPILFCINKDQLRSSEALVAGPIDFILRPFTDDALREKVRNLQEGIHARKTEESAAILKSIVTTAEAEVDLPFFLRLPTALMQEFLRLGAPTRHAAGSTIFERGDRVESLHVITSGEGEIVEGLGRVVHVCHEAECIGEVPFLMNQPAPNAGRARTAMELVSLSKMRLAELVKLQPRMTDHLASLMTRHTKRLAAGPATRIQSELMGSLEATPFADVIQLLVAAQKTGVLGLKSGPWSGGVYIDGGEVVHAWTEELTGEEAFYKIAAQSSAKFAFNSVPRKEPRTIQQPTMTLLMEAMRRVDEERRTGTGAA